MKTTRKLKIIFEDKDILAIEKPPGIVTIPDNAREDGTFLKDILSSFPELRTVNERGGILHRLDKDTSGLVLVARNKKSFEFFKKAFKERKIGKNYLALTVGNIKDKRGEIITLIGRSPKNRKKQKAFLLHEPQAKKEGLRRAVTGYRVLKYLSDGKNHYTLVEVLPKTGRKHQIRVHLAYLGYPIAGDKIYGFKNQPVPKNLSRQFLHANYLKIKLADGKEKELYSPLAEDLGRVLDQLAEA